MVKSKGDKILDAINTLKTCGVKFPKVVRYVIDKQGAQLKSPNCVLPWWDDRANVQKHIDDNRDAYFISEFGSIFAYACSKYKYHNAFNLVKLFEDATIEETIIYLAGLEAIKDGIQFLPKTTGISIKEILG